MDLSPAQDPGAREKPQTNEARAHILKITELLDRAETQLWSPNEALMDSPYNRELSAKITTTKQIITQITALPDEQIALAWSQANLASTLRMIFRSHSSRWESRVWAARARADADKLIGSAPGPAQERIADMERGRIAAIQMNKELSTAMTQLEKAQATQNPESTTAPVKLIDATKFGHLQELIRIVAGLIPKETEVIFGITAIEFAESPELNDNEAPVPIGAAEKLKINVRMLLSSIHTHNCQTAIYSRSVLAALKDSLQDSNRSPDRTLSDKILDAIMKFEPTLDFNDPTDSKRRDNIAKFEKNIQSIFKELLG